MVCIRGWGVWWGWVWINRLVRTSVWVVLPPWIVVGFENGNPAGAPEWVFSSQTSVPRRYDAFFPFI